MSYLLDPSTPTHLPHGFSMWLRHLTAWQLILSGNHPRANVSEGRKQRLPLPWRLDQKWYALLWPGSGAGGTHCLSPRGSHVYVRKGGDRGQHLRDQPPQQPRLLPRWNCSGGKALCPECSPRDCWGRASAVWVWWYWKPPEMILMCSQVWEPLA